MPTTLELILQGQVDAANSRTQIAGAVAKQEANLENLGNNFDKHCADDEKRHAENLATLREIRDNLATLASIVTPLASAVGTMKPIVDGYQVTKMKFAGALLVGGFLVTAIGWIVSSIVGEAMKLAFQKLGWK